MNQAERMLASVIEWHNQQSRRCTKPRGGLAPHAEQKWATRAETHERSAYRLRALPLPKPTAVELAREAFNGVCRAMFDAHSKHFDSPVNYHTYRRLETEAFFAHEALLAAEQAAEGVGE